MTKKKKRFNYLKKEKSAQCGTMLKRNGIFPLLMCVTC